MKPSESGFRVADAHCHVVDGGQWTSIISELDDECDRIIVMTTGFDNIDKLCGEQVLPRSVIPAFGFHPWMAGSVYFENRDKLAHYREVLNPCPSNEDISQLVEPRPFAEYLDLMRKYLTRNPQAVVGELGLDKPFRLALDDDKLSPFRVGMDHQRRVFGAQLALAGEFKRPISVHSVQCHGHVFNDVARLSKGIPAVCLHSYSGSVDQLRQWLDWSRSSHVELFMSFSAVFSLENRKLNDYLEILPDSSFLTESDLSQCSFEELVSHNDRVLKYLAKAKGYSEEDMRKKIKENFLRFVKSKE